MALGLPVRLSTTLVQTEISYLMGCHEILYIHTSWMIIRNDCGDPLIITDRNNVNKTQAVIKLYIFSDDETRLNYLMSISSFELSIYCMLGQQK